MRELYDCMGSPSACELGRVGESKDGWVYARVGRGVRKRVREGC